MLRRDIRVHCAGLQSGMTFLRIVISLYTDDDGPCSGACNGM
jgi:hypothetical protein